MPRESHVEQQAVGGDGRGQGRGQGGGSGPGAMEGYFLVNGSISQISRIGLVEIYSAKFKVCMTSIDHVKADVGLRPTILKLFYVKMR